MAVGRDVMGADGLTNAQRYAKRQADAKARQAAFRAQQDAKKAAAAKEAAAAPVSSPSSMFGGLMGTTQQVRNPPPSDTLGFGHQQTTPIKTQTPPPPPPPPAATTQDTLGFGHEQTPPPPPPPPKKTTTKTPDRSAAIAAQALADARAAAEAQRKAEAQRQAEAQAAAQAAAEAAAQAQDTLGFGHEQTTTTPPPPPVNEGMLTPLEQLAADGNTKAQQREQAADDFYGMSNAQREALQGYYDRGIIDPETNLISEEFLLNPENNDALYQMFTGGFGLGKNDLHSSLISQAQAGWTAQGQAANPYDAAANDGLTFGGGSNAGDYVRTPPTYVDPPPPPTTAVDPPPSQVDPDIRRQEEQDARNKAFMDFLGKLGLSSLVDLFNGINVPSGGLAGSNAAESTYTPYTPQAYTPSQVDYNSMLTTANEVGYDPYRGLYNVPDAMKSTADQLGLFSYINSPQATPMAPYNPMAGITVPQIDYTQLGKTPAETGD